MRLLLPICFWIISTIAFAGVDTVAIYSKAMRKTAKAVVITPNSYGKNPQERYPVVYLLHGYSGNYANWIQRVPELTAYASQFNMMIVCPDGDYSSWYWDSPIDSTFRYETYIGKEVPAFIDEHYLTRTDSKYRAITGLSMGGHGGLFIGWKHADRFGACGSMSGGVDIRDFSKQFDIAKRIGLPDAYPQHWKDYTVFFLVDQKPVNIPQMIIDCGVDDFFYKYNAALHQKLLGLKIPHEYIERPGKHDWQYWRNAVVYQLLFFKQVFAK